MADAEEKELYLSIWSKAVETQMHFNDMCVKSRQFGLAFVAAALGLGVVLLGRGQDASIDLPYFCGFKLHATVLIAASSAFSLYAVKLLDLKVYHKMLRGAVTFGEDFEQTYMKEIFDLEKGMTQAISHYSRFKDAKVIMENGKYKYTGCERENAEKKINRFYWISIIALSALSLVMFAATADFKVCKAAKATPNQTQTPPISVPSNNDH